jgi:Tol biopolymer transport system component
MTEPTGFDRMLTGWLDDMGAQDAPPRLKVAAIEQARRTKRSRPLPDFLTRWLSMSTYFSTSLPVPLVRRAPLARIGLAFVLLMLALLGAAVLSAALGSPQPIPHVGNGLIALASHGDIDVVQPDGSGRQTLIGGPAFQTAPSWSPDGTRIAYWSHDTAGSTWNVDVANADGSNPVTIATSNFIGSGVVGMNRLQWSPNGQTIAFSAATATPGTYQCAGFGSQNGDFCSYRIFVAATDGSGSHAIGDQTVDARSPAWSPTGDMLAFGRGNASSVVDLYVMGLDGSNERRVGPASGQDWAFTHTDWSFDGSEIVGQAGSAANIGNWDIWVTKADGTGATDISNDAFTDDNMPYYAPDRAAIVWSTDHIMVQEPNGVAEALAGPAGCWSWSPDGQLLAAITGTNNDTFSAMDLTGAVKTTVLGPFDTACANVGFSWQPSLSNP